MHNKAWASWGLQCGRHSGTKHSSWQYEAREQDSKVPTIGQSKRDRGDGLRSRLLVKHRKWECMITGLFLHPKAQRKLALDPTLRAAKVRQQRRTVTRRIFLVMRRPLRSYNKVLVARDRE